MRLKILSLLGLVLLLGSRVMGQPSSCLDSYQDLRAVDPQETPGSQDARATPVIAWFGDCILLGSRSGLWLHDPAQPDSLIQLARSDEHAVGHIIVNPVTQTIAYNYANESTIHFIHADGATSTMTASGEVISDIAYSHDGRLLAVASHNDYGPGFVDDARVQILNADGNTIATIASEKVLIPSVFFSTDDRHVLTYEIDPGYIGGEASFWDFRSLTLLWSYSDLLDELQPWAGSDPLIVSSVTMYGDEVALSGIAGYFNDRNFTGLGVHIWNAATQQRQLEISVKMRTDEEYIYILPDLMTVFDASGSVLATSLGNEAIQLWDINNGAQIGEFTVDKGRILQMYYSPDNARLAVLTDEALTLLDTGSMEVAESFPLCNIDVDGQRCSG